MKITSLLQKTALAAAIAGASFSASAGVLDIAAPGVLAVELFGDAKNALEESNKTSVTLPKIDFYASVGGDLVGKSAGSDGATIKLTLLEHMLFAENYQDPNTWASQGIEIQVDGKVVKPNDVAAVDAGTGSDNTITITFRDSSGDAPPGSLDGTEKLFNVLASGTPAVSIKGLKVTRLKNPLQTPGATASVTVEVRAINDNAGAALGVANEAFENTPSTVALVSTKGVDLTGTATDYAGAPASSRGYIQVADAQQSFTDAITPVPSHRDDFDETTNAIPRLNLGTLSIVRGTVPAGLPGAGLEAGKETGTKFDFTGADTLKLSVTGDAPLALYGLELRTDACSNAGNPANRLSSGVVNPVVDPNTAVFAVNTTDTNLDAATAWNLCGVSQAVGTDRIPQLGSLSAKLKVEYGNVRYGESEGGVEYGPVLRNGCQVTLFNVPAGNDTDKAFIRLTNTSLKAGQVNAYMYTQGGELIDNDALVLGNLPAHATAVLHTNTGFANQEDVTKPILVDLSSKMPEYAALTSAEGRNRIVIQGAFPSCEALGLVRSGTGPLTNMTSTTNSDSNLPAGTGTYGTTNTGN